MGEISPRFAVSRGDFVLPPAPAAAAAVTVTGPKESEYSFDSLSVAAHERTSDFVINLASEGRPSPPLTLPSLFTQCIIARLIGKSGGTRRQSRFPDSPIAEPSMLFGYLIKESLSVEIPHGEFRYSFVHPPLTVN